MERPVLNPLQQAWLQEIGIDGRMLAHFSAASFPDDGEGPLAGAPAPRQRPRPEAATPDGPVAIGEVLTCGNPSRAPVPIPAQQHAPASPMHDHGSAPRAPDHAAAPPVPSVPDGTLESLMRQVEGCNACGLHQMRSRTVFGEGVAATPRWMFIGEAPGEYDDSAGRPFQGRAGELLQAMLASVGIDDATPLYFTNVLKCRPMGNRSPAADEIAACMPVLRRQITLLRPGCLVALGRVSAGALLGRADDLDTLRGEVHAYVDDEGRSIPVVVMHHPASLLLHAQYKADAWRDLHLMLSV